MVRRVADGSAAGAGDAAPVEIPEDMQPQIRCEIGKPHEWIAKSIASLRADPDIYVRDSGLCHVTRITEEEADASIWTDKRGRKRRALSPGSPKIHTMSKSTLRVRMARWAAWTRPKCVKGKWEDQSCEPSKEQAEELRDEEHFPGIPHLVGIATTPFPRPDLSIVQGEPGHDPATGYLYEPSMVFPLVDDAPSQAECARRREHLEDLFVDFPFANGAIGQSGAVALVATMICRPAIMGPVPSWIIGATTPGTGKTLLTDICAAVAYGRDAGRTPFPDATGRNSDEELSKRLGMFAKRGAAHVNFDNCDEAVIGGDSLETMITVREDYTFRILGVSDGLTVPVRMVLTFTANNPQWSRGMNRRILNLSLESPFADPEHRPEDSYQHPERAGRLFVYALEHRAEYVTDVLTIVAGYLHARCPGRLTVGTFEEWAALIPSALVWAGGENPMLCRPGADGEESPDTAQRGTLAREWTAYCEAMDIDAATTHAVVEALYPQRERGQPLDPKWDALRGAIEFFVPPRRAGEAPDAGKLGDAFRRRLKGAPIRTHDAPAPLRRFVAAKMADGRVSKSGGRTRWTVEDVPAYRATPAAKAPERAPEPPAPVAEPEAVASPPAPTEPTAEDAYADLVAQLRAEEGVDFEPEDEAPK